jgi:hypothetical protein
VLFAFTLVATLTQIGSDEVSDALAGTCAFVILS